MSTDSVGTDERGISEIYGTILVIALAFAVSVLIVGAGFLLLDDSFDKSDDQLGQDSITEFDERISTVLSSVDQNETWAPPEGSEDDFTGNASAGRVNLTVKTTDKYWEATENTTGDAGDLVDADPPQKDFDIRELGTLRHEGSNGVTTAYQGGAVFEKQDDSVTVIEAPNIEVSENRLSLGLVNISSFPQVSTGEEFEIQGSQVNSTGLQEMVNEAIKQNDTIVGETEINMTITSEFAKGWGSYAINTFDRVSDENVTYISDNKVKIQFGIFGNGINVTSRFKDPIVYSGLSDYAPEMHNGTTGTINEVSPGFNATPGTINGASPGFEVGNSGTHSVGAYLNTSKTDDPEWWVWNTTSGKWENVERSNKEINQTAPSNTEFPVINKTTDAVGLADETVTCVINTDDLSDYEPSDFLNYVDDAGEDCFDKTLAVDETDNLVADPQPYLEVTDVDTEVTNIPGGPDPGPMVLDYYGDENLNVTVDVTNTGPGNATEEPLGVFLADDNVGEVVVAGTDVTVNRTESAQPFDDRGIPTRFLLADEPNKTTNFGVGAATANDRSVEDRWTLSKGTSITEIGIAEIDYTGSDPHLAGEPINGTITFNTSALDPFEGDQNISVFLRAGSNTGSVDVSLAPNKTQTDEKDFTLNTSPYTAAYDNVTAAIPQVDNASASVNATLPDNDPDFEITDVEYGGQTSVDVGEELTVNATVKNVGGVGTVQPVRLGINKSGMSGPGETLALEGSVDLSSGQEEEVQLVWEPTVVYADETFDLSVYTPQDNSSAESVTVEPFANDGDFNVEIQDAPDSVTSPDQVAVNVKIENVGNGTAEKLVWLSTENELTAFNLTSVELSSGESTTETLYWETDRDDAGDRTVVVETQDDSDTKDVDVIAPSDEADLYLTDITLNDPSSGTMTAGQQANVTVTVENPGDEDGDLPGSGVIILENIFGDGTDTNETGLIGSGETETYDLSWQSFPGDNGTGDLTAVLDGQTLNTSLTVDPQVERNRSPLDITFVHDESGSMEDNDEDKKRVDATKQFVGQLNDSMDRVAYVQFDAYLGTSTPPARIEQDLTSAFDSFNASLEPDPDGDTNISAGIDKGIETLTTDTVPGSMAEGEGQVWRSRPHGNSYLYSGDQYNLRENYTKFDVGEQIDTINASEQGSYEINEGEVALLDEYDGGTTWPILPGQTAFLDEETNLCGVFPFGPCEEDQLKIYELENESKVTAQSRNPTMILLGDGEHDPSNRGYEPDPDEMAEIADDYGITIYTVGLGEDIRGDTGEETLKEIANETGGGYEFAEDADDLVDEFLNISEDVIDVEAPEFEAEITNGSLDDKSIGDGITVEAEVTNNGKVSGERPIWLVEEFTGTPVDSVTADIDNGSAETVTLSWDPIELADAQFNGSDTATADLSVRTANSTDSLPLTVKNEDSDFQITDAKNVSDTPIPPNGEITIDATVTNVESGFGEKEIRLRAPWGAPVDTATPKLNGSESTEVSLTWNLSNIRLTRDSVNVTVTTEDDNATVENINLEEVSDEIPPYEIVNVTTNADVADNKSIEAGETLDVTAYVRNKGNTTAEQFVKLQDINGEVEDLKRVAIPNDGNAHEVDLTWQTTVYDNGVGDVNVSAAVGGYNTSTVNVTAYDPDAEFSVSIDSTNASPPASNSIVAGSDALVVNVTIANTGEPDRAIVNLNNADDTAGAVAIPTLKDFGRLGDGADAGQTATGTLIYETTADADEIDNIGVAVEQYNASDEQNVTVEDQTLNSSVEIDTVESTNASDWDNTVTAGSGTVDVNVTFADAPDDGDTVTMYEGNSTDSEDLIGFVAYENDSSKSAELTWTPLAGDGDNTGPRTLTVSAGGATETVEVYINEAPSELIGELDPEQPDPVGIDVDEIQVSG